MKCQSCQKKEAKVHFTEFGESGAVKLHLCPDCAQAKGLGEPGPVAASAPAPSESEVRCAACGLSLADFRKKGRLGCGQCYQAFADAFGPLLSAIHRSRRHVGKVPAAHPPGSPETDLVSLRESLRAAVEKEKFEEAARLCGLIKKLERKT